jgi:hypothetical protein
VALGRDDQLLVFGIGNGFYAHFEPLFSLGMLCAHSNSHFEQENAQAFDEPLAREIPKPD